MPLKLNKLTRSSLRRLRSGDSLTEHGITFERLQNGDGRYSVNMMVDGQRIRRVIGRESDGVTRRQTEDFIEKARTDARAGRLKLPKGRKMTLGLPQAAKEYLDKLAQVGGKNLVMKGRRLRIHLMLFLRINH